MRHMQLQRCAIKHPNAPYGMFQPMGPNRRRSCVCCVDREGGGGQGGVKGCFCPGVIPNPVHLASQAEPLWRVNPISESKARSLTACHSGRPSHNHPPLHPLLHSSPAPPTHPTPLSSPRASHTAAAPPPTCTHACMKTRPKSRRLMALPCVQLSSCCSSLLPIRISKLVRLSIADICCFKLSGRLLPRAAGGWLDGDSSSSGSSLCVYKGGSTLHDCNRTCMLALLVYLCFVSTPASLRMVN